MESGFQMLLGAILRLTEVNGVGCRLVASCKRSLGLTHSTTRINVLLPTLEDKEGCGIVVAKKIVA